MLGGMHGHVYPRPSACSDRRAEGEAGVVAWQCRNQWQWEPRRPRTGRFDKAWKSRASARAAVCSDIAEEIPCRWLTSSPLTDDHPKYCQRRYRKTVLELPDDRVLISAPRVDLVVLTQYGDCKQRIQDCGSIKLIPNLHVAWHLLKQRSKHKTM